MISPQETKHIARLARLGLNDKEIEKMQRELSVILDYIKLLEGLDVSNVEPTSHSIPVFNVLRKDEGSPQREEVVDDIKEMFPEREGDCIKVKKVLEQ